eukprot:gnl/TRDRNA2_/TRDRNA2_165275_c0_seq1.p1 gnl/TRDRNA2_/TRDRNA2_165275_c0~~gnl/TRDRNA2_/TRDRNA2_165275_c0_seq1.p1  ORF type:complete len:438 (+),score=70.11 gnl/TRDRNA2_/TRDRNA2_165275_c0_seq1:88-1401(+)
MAAPFRRAGVGARDASPTPRHPPRISDDGDEDESLSKGNGIDCFGCLWWVGGQICLWSYLLCVMTLCVAATWTTFICGATRLLRRHGRVGHLYRLLEQHGDDAVGHLANNPEIPLGQASEKTLAFGMLARTSALELAVSNGYAAAVEALLSSGAKPGAGWQLGPRGILGLGTPLVTAAKAGHVSAAEALLRTGAEPSEGWNLGFGLVGVGTPLSEAAKSGHAELVQVLLRARASPRLGREFGPYASLWREEPLISAASALRGSEAVASLLGAGADPGVDGGWSFGPCGFLGKGAPLRGAAWAGDNTSVSLLLKARAAPDIGWSLGPFGLLWSDAPLVGASRNGHVAMVEELLASGAPPDSTGQAEELRRAAWRGHLAVVEVLLQAGALPDRAGKAVQGAARGNHTAVLKALLDASHRARCLQSGENREKGSACRRDG